MRYLDTVVKCYLEVNFMWYRFPDPKSNKYLNKVLKDTIKQTPGYQEPDTKGYPDRNFEEVHSYGAM